MQLPVLIKLEKHASLSRPFPAANASQHFTKSSCAMFTSGDKRAHIYHRHIFLGMFYAVSFRLNSLNWVQLFFLNLRFHLECKSSAVCCLPFAQEVSLKSKSVFLCKIHECMLFYIIRTITFVYNKNKLYIYFFKMPFKNIFYIKHVYTF